MVSAEPAERHLLASQDGLNVEIQVRADVGANELAEGHQSVASWSKAAEFVIVERPEPYPEFAFDPPDALSSDCRISQLVVMAFVAQLRCRQAGLVRKAQGEPLTLKLQNLGGYAKIVAD